MLFKQALTEPESLIVQSQWRINSLWPELNEYEKSTQEARQALHSYCGERQEPFQSEKQLNTLLALTQLLREFLLC